MKRFVSVLLFVALSAGMALADSFDSNDPSFFENLSGCAGANWCASVGTAVDPLSGMTTEMYTFNTSYIPSVVSGDVKITEFGSSTVGDLIRFEQLPAGAYVAFIYSDDVSGGLAADVGLPSSFQTNSVTIAETSTGITTLYTPASTPAPGQPGYTGLTTGSYANTTYALTSSDVVPEPSSFALFGSGLLGLAGMLRRKLRR